MTTPPPDPNTPVDYPANYPPLPPPVYPPPTYPGPAGYPYQPYPPAPGYPYDPYDPYRQLKPAGTNGKAIAALVTSLAGLTCCGLPSIAGIVLGIIAMRETRRTGQDGFGLALAGLITGSVVLLLVVLYVVFVVVIAANSTSYTGY